MCIAPKVSAPKPASPPAPPSEPPAPPKSPENIDRTGIRQRRKGKRGLTIPLQSGGSGNGLNIP